jgi:hypothetical protein
MTTVNAPFSEENIAAFTSDLELIKQKRYLDRLYKQAMYAAMRDGKEQADMLLRVYHREEVAYCEALLAAKDRRRNRTFLDRITPSIWGYGMSDRTFASLVALSSAQYPRHSSLITFWKRDSTDTSTSDTSKKTFACYVGTVIPQKQKSLSLYYYVRKP